MAVEGTCIVLVEQLNSPYLGASGTGSSATPIPQEGGYKILASESVSGSTSITSPEWVVSGAWNPSGAADTEFKRSERIFKPTSGSSSLYDSFFSSGNLYPYRCIEQSVIFLMVPAFSQGLDASSSIDYAWDRPRLPGDPGRVSASGGSAKMILDAGRGEAMYVGGSVQIQHGWTEFPGLGVGMAPSPLALPELLWGHPNESLEYLDYFTDTVNHRRFPLSFGTQLRFAGPERDYKVFYETRFGHGRADLEEWPESWVDVPGNGWQHGMAYYWEWQKPRLRQVLGREGLIDIAVGADDYTHVISVFRIPVDHTIDYEADGFVKTTGLVLLKTVTIDGSTRNADGFPTDDLEISVETDGGGWIVQGSAGTDPLGYPVNWDVTLVNSHASAVLLEESWSSVVDYATTDPVSMNLIAFEAPLMQSFQVIATEDGSTATETTNTFTTMAVRSLVADPLPRVSNISQASDAGTATTALTYEAGANPPDFPTTFTITEPDAPQVTIKLQTSGIPHYFERGTGTTKWRSDWELDESGLLRAEHSLGGNTYSRDWTKWENGGWTITRYSAPSGRESSPEEPGVDWTKLEIGSIGGVGFVGLPHKLTRKYDSGESGSTWNWTVSADGSTTLETADGLFSGNSVTNGIRFLIETNQRGYLTSSGSNLLQNGTPLQIAGSETPDGQFTTWGAPIAVEDFNTKLTASWTFDGQRERLGSATDLLGNISNFNAYDALERPTAFSWKGHSGSATYNNGGFGASSTLNIPGRPLSRSSSWDARGRPTGGSVTAGGSSSFSMSHAAGAKTLTTNNTVTGAAATIKIRPEDGSLEDATGNTLAFGGLDGHNLAVDDGSGNSALEGLIRSRTSLGDLSSAFRTTWTDAWGRVRHVVTSGTDGANDDETRILYSNSGSATKRVKTHLASGMRHIEEIEPWTAGGIITRSGIDMNNSGTLDGGDRFITTTTTIVGSILRTTITQTGNATPLMVRDYNPSNGVTVTTLNGGEEVITEEPDFDNKTSEISHERNGTLVSKRTITLNHLGQATEDNVEGTGVAERNLVPTFRDDGSLASVSLTVGGATASASFNANGTLSTFTHPALGPLTVSHGFANGTETLAVHGTTATRALDDSASLLTGAGVMDRSRATTISGGQWFEDKITPSTGAPTSMFANPSGAKELHDYAAGPDRGMSWLAGGLLESVSLGRGGASMMAYTADGARDLESITWPTVSSAGFPEQPFYGGSVGFPERDGAGNITTITDPSGKRSLDYQKNRLTETDWLEGELSAYKVVRQHDTRGRLQSVAVHRHGPAIHTVTPGYNGLSDEVSGISATGFSASVTRDAAGRHVTGFTRGPVTQRWVRGTAGRITAADTQNTVSGAPTFSYTGFDNRGRRQTVVTSKGTWTYDFHVDGQLDSAANSTLGFDLSYHFDGIGRRNFGNNQQDALNRFRAIQHPQVAKKLFLSADPDARLYAAQGGGALTELTPFNGSRILEVNHPGASGGWVPWHVRGVLEDAGDPGAHPDAVAEFSGQLWFPPENETINFDDDGNREDSSLWNYGWDGRNKLVRARTKAWDTAPEGWDLKFDYDAEGRRFKKTVTRFADGEPVEHKVIYFVWDGWDLLFERHEDGNGNPFMERRYVWGPDIVDGAAGGAGGLLLFRETRGQTTKDYYPLYDGTGHVVGLADGAGNLVAEYWWGPFGELIEAKGEMAQANPWRYATKYFDSETGLYYFGHRYYEPVTGQWLNREPLGEDESLNLYAYCHNDPINKVDVLGLSEAAITGGFMDATGMTRDIKNFFNMIFGGWWSSDKAETAELRFPEGRMGGVTGGALQVATFGALQPEIHRTSASELGIWMGRPIGAVYAAPFVLGQGGLQGGLQGSRAGYTYGGQWLSVHGSSAVSSIGATTFTFGRTAMLGSGTTYTIGQIGTASVITAETGMLAWMCPGSA
jgi:RHS repeat-associated protein